MFICGNDAKAKEQVALICKEWDRNSIDASGMSFPITSKLLP